MKLHPLLVGLINAVLPGLGYVIIGERKVFGWLLLAGSICCIVLSFIEPAYMSRTLLISTTATGRIFELAWYVLFLAAYGYDGYTLARAQKHASQLPVVITTP